MTEDAYLTVLAASLGTSYEPLERILRADCPLDDDQLVQAAAAGLLPVCEAGEIVWIMAPRCLTDRRLASQSQPAWLQSLRLTSSERLLRFVARHTQKALGRRATLCCGYALTIALDVVGLRRRRLLAHAWVLLLTPPYWFLLSVAAWRALFQLLHDPQGWEKTEHGLARTSRLAESERY